MRTSTLRAFALPVSLACALTVGFGFTRAPAAPAVTGTPVELVATYSSLADTILAVKATEDSLVRSILAVGYAQAEQQMQAARAAIAVKDMVGAKVAIEAAAAFVAQLASEGDNAVAAVRKRLLEGGHHHNAAGEAQGLYEPGYVVVTRDAKKALLGASRAIAMVASAPDAGALDAAWLPVEGTWLALAKVTR